MIVKISGYESTINDRDFEKFSKLKWRVNRKEEKDGRFYFQAWQYINGKKKTVTLHRYLMDCTVGDGKIVDHIDGNTLNNDTDNLRICNNTENSRNARKHKDSSSPYKGIYWNKRDKKWIARITNNGKQISLGRFPTAEIAYEAYCKAVPIYHKEFGRIK